MCLVSVNEPTFIFVADVTAQSELAAVKKEHQSIILRDASTARELEKQLFELECLHERLERLQIMPGISAENDDAITYYIDLIATDANGLEGEILEQVQKEENGHRHTDESGGGGRTRTAPVRAAARPITAALNDSLPESPQKPKRRAGKPKNDVPAEKLTPKKRAKKAAAVPAVAKPAAAQGLRESPYETKAPPLSALPAALPARVPVPKNPAESTTVDLFSLTILYSATATGFG